MKGISRIPIWLQWIVATTGSLALGFGLAGAVTGILYARYFFSGVLISGASMWLVALWLASPLIVFGISVALMIVGQWAILRQRISRAKSWLPFTGVGYALAIPTTGPVSCTAMFIWGYSGPARAIDITVTIACLAGSLLVGILQWLYLRRVVQKAGWWILASVVAWVLSLGWLSLIFAANLPEGSEGVIDLSCALAPVFLAFALPTCIAMQFLLAEDNIKPEYRIAAPMAASG